jgi:hypothetical protein
LRLFLEGHDQPRHIEIMWSRDITRQEAYPATPLQRYGECAILSTTLPTFRWSGEGAFAILQQAFYSPGIRDDELQQFLL